jgi:cyanophycin synthetase
MTRPSRFVNDIALTSAARADYRRTGALHIQGLFTGDGMELLIQANEEDVQQADHPEKFTSAFDRYSNRLFSRSDRLKGVVDKLKGVLAEIVGEDIVFTQGLVLHMKQGTLGFAWHFDEFSFCFVRPQDMGFTLWIPLIPIYTEQQHGGLIWVNQDDFSARNRMQQWAHYEKRGRRAGEPGDRYGTAKNGQYGDTWVGPLDQELLTDLKQGCDMELGDALVFDRYTWHKSHPLGPGPIPSRTAIVLRVVSADARFDKALFENVMANRADQDPPPSFGHLLAAFDDGTPMREAVAAGVSIFGPAAWAVPPKPSEHPEIRPAQEGDLQQELVLRAAARRGIRITDLSDLTSCKAAVLESGGRSELLLKGVVASAMNLKTKSYCDYKQLTKILFERLQIPTPKSMLFRGLDEPGLETFIEDGKKYVCKPQVAANGAGVEMGVTSFEQVRDYWRRNRGMADSFLLEEQVDGEDLRIQVIGGRIAASCVREPAYVVGDGRQTLAKLVERRQRIVHQQNPSDRLELDRTSFALIEEQGLTLESVPEAGRRVRLKAVSNIGQGGVAIDVTDEVHPGYAEWVRRIVAFCDASFFALDLICQDHTQAPESGAVALELNALAEWTHHTYSEGGTRDLGEVVIDAAFGQELGVLAS